MGSLWAEIPTRSPTGSISQQGRRGQHYQSPLANSTSSQQHRVRLAVYITFEGAKGGTTAMHGRTPKSTSHPQQINHKPHSDNPVPQTRAVVTSIHWHTCARHIPCHTLFHKMCHRRRSSSARAAPHSSTAALLTACVFPVLA